MDYYLKKTEEGKSHYNALGHCADKLVSFDSPSKVLAYAGLNPVVRQSGKWRASSTRMSKRGDPLLLYTLI